MRKLPALILFLFLVANSFAQKSLLEGWVQLNNGDTLRGKIHEKDWNVNPNKIDFYHPGLTTYGVSELKSFGIDGSDQYLRCEIERHQLPYSEYATFPADETKVERGQAWLKILVKAPVTLAVFYQSDRPYFYAIDANDKATELVASKGLREYSGEQYKSDPRFGQSVSVDQPVYKGQLTELFPSSESIIDPSLIDYNEKSLTSAFVKLNHLKKEKSKYQTFFIGISAGVSSYTHSLEGDAGTLLEGAEFQNTISPFIRASFNFQLGKKRSPRFSLVPEVGFSTMNVKGSKTKFAGEYTYTINNTFLELAVLTKFWLNPAARNKFYLMAGINGYIHIAGESRYQLKSISGNIQTFPNEPEQKTFVIAPSFTAGYEISKFSLFVNYQMLGNLTTYQSQSWSANRLSIGASYYLKKKQ